MTTRFWSSIWYEQVLQKQILSENPLTFTNMHSTLFEEIEELVDLRVTSERNEEVVFANIVAVVRNKKIFRTLCQLNSTCAEVMKPILRECATELDNLALHREGTVSATSTQDPRDEKLQPEDGPISVYVDRSYTQVGTRILGYRAFSPRDAGRYRRPRTPTKWIR